MKGAKSALFLGLFLILANPAMSATINCSGEDCKTAESYKVDFKALLGPAKVVDELPKSNFTPAFTPLALPAFALSEYQSTFLNCPPPPKPVPLPASMFMVGPALVGMLGVARKIRQV